MQRCQDITWRCLGDALLEDRNESSALRDIAFPGVGRGETSSVCTGKARVGRMCTVEQGIIKIMLSYGCGCKSGLYVRLIPIILNNLLFFGPTNFQGVWLGNLPMEIQCPSPAYALSHAFSANCFMYLKSTMFLSTVSLMTLAAFAPYFSFHSASHSDSVLPCFFCHDE
jgi:hypothetical protein